jgi:hypothetical protein
MYHLSAPSTSRNPSLLESLPRRRLWFGIGIAAPAGRGEVICMREEAEDEGPGGGDEGDDELG